MSERGWGETGWDAGEHGHEPLPKLEDLPIAEQGYDRDAVREAFDSFYRHSAQLDATLRLLSSVEVFGRQARELRADIRSLRAASWGPAPSARHVWSVGHETWRADEPISGSLPDALPRLAVWAALIILVGVGAALADLSTALIIVLVLGAWLLVALLEVGLSARASARRPPAFTALAPAESAGTVAPAAVEAEEVEEVDELVVEPAPAVDDAGEATMIEPAPVEDEPEEVDEAPAPGPPSHVRVLRPEPVPEAQGVTPEEVVEEPDASAEEAELGEVERAPEPLPWGAAAADDPWENAAPPELPDDEDTDPGVAVAEREAVEAPAPPARLARFRRGRR
jgi:hypothetical protein